MASLRTLLEEWGIEEEYIQNFEREKFKESSLLLVSEKSVERLIPQEGPRLEFLSKLKFHKNKSDHPQENNNNVGFSLEEISQMPIVFDISPPDVSLLDSDADANKRSHTENLDSGSSDDDEPLILRASRQKKSSQLPLGEGEGDNSLTAKPLVDKSLIGAPRRATKGAAEAIDELNLKTFFSDYPSCAAVLCSYRKKRILTDSDRSTLTETLVEWLVKQTEFPKKEHYTILCEKIIALFPTEKHRTWYIPPYTENDGQKYGKGKLYDKVRNCKSNLRKKGFLPPPNPKKMKKAEATPQPIQSSEEKAAEAWLMRNQEPFDEVQIYWKRCSLSRLKELLVKLTPAEYIEKWKGIIKMPEAKKLIMDDFEVLPEVDSAYECLRGKGSNLLQKWSGFVESVQKLTSDDDISGLSSKEKERFYSLLQNAPNENIKDYIILQILPLLCKQKGRVKFGKKYIRPTAEESKDSFILFVPGAGEFDNYLRERQKRHRKAGATVAPYVVVLGPAKEDTVSEDDSSEGEEEITYNINDVTVSAAYVIINEVPWKIGSVLGAVDVCFKSYFSIHTDYPPESYHLWQLIQKHLYDIRLEKETVYTCVSDFISKVEFVSQ